MTAQIIPFPYRARAWHGSKKSCGIGVIIQPPGCETSAYIMGGNIAGFIASWIGFHRDFDPALFGQQERHDRGVNLQHEPYDDGPDAA